MASSSPVAAPAPLPAPAKAAPWYKPWLAESKVIASAAATAGVGIAIGVLNDTAANGDLLGSLPAAVQWIVLVVVPPLVAYLTGWAARHTSRPGA